MKKNAIWLIIMFSMVFSVSAQENTVVVPLKPALVTRVKRLTFTKDKGGFLKAKTALNIPLIKRVVRQAEDLKSITFELGIGKMPFSISVLKEIEEPNKKMQNLSDLPSLQNIPLEAGDRLMISAFKPSYHWNGGAGFNGLEISDANGQSLSFEEYMNKGQKDAEIGKLELAGIADFGRFPDIKYIKPLEKKGDKWTLPKTSLKVTITKGEISFHHNGRTNFSPESGTAPAFIFTPKKAGIYKLSGKVDFRSAKKEHKIKLLVGIITDPSKSVDKSTLSLHRILKPGGTLNLGSDVEKAPFFSGKVVENKPFKITGIAKTVREWLSGKQKDCGMLITITPPAGRKITPYARDRNGSITVVSHTKDVIFNNPIVPQPGVYAQMKDGKLFYGDKRLKLWGMVAGGMDPVRIKGMGYNCVRTWFSKNFYDKESALKGEVMTYTKGDNSTMDKFDKFFGGLKENGIFVMFATTIGNGRMTAKVMAADNSWLAKATPEGWSDWKKAVNESLQSKKPLNGLECVDERFEKVRMRHAKNVMNHKNLYTGKRYAEEESIALIEINNEASLLKRWLEGGLNKMHPYFHKEFADKWNVWLKKKYTDDKGLIKAWGKLDDGESLANAKIKLKPLMPERNKYSAARQDDVVAFCIETIDTFHQKYRNFCRNQAPKGVGANVVPYSFDSQYRPNIPWTYLISLGDTSTTSMYFWKNGSMLDAPPSLYVIDSHRVDGKLGVIYETNRGRPSPYRAEYPYMLAAMIAWQDFDIAVWHGTWAFEKKDEEHLALPADGPSSSHFWTACHLEGDQVMCSAIALAGRFFINSIIPAAPNPEKVEISEADAQSYSTWNGVKLTTETFTTGSRIKFVKEKTQRRMENKPSLKPKQKTGELILWDSENARLIIDSPTAKVYAGKTVPEFTFADGITISGFDTPFVVFSMVSLDGKSLIGENSSNKIALSAVFDAKNTNFKYDYNCPGGPVQQARKVKDFGHAPVIVDKVSCTISLPETLVGNVSDFDFARRLIEKTPLASNTIRLKQQTDWMQVVEISSRTGKAKIAVDPSPGVVADKKNIVAAEKRNAVYNGVWNPIPSIKWGDNYAMAHKTIRNSTAVFNSISQEDYSKKSHKEINLTECDKLFFNSTVNAKVIFEDDRMKHIMLEFVTAPSFLDLIKNCEKEFGQPKSKNLVQDAFKESKVSWVKKYSKGNLDIVATEVQGIIRISFSFTEI